jgi:acyl carrier protein
VSASSQPLDERALQDGLVELLRRIAPELEALDPGAPLREAVDLDSMDFLNFLAAIAQRYGVEIPDADAGSLLTLRDVVAYVAPRTAG